MALATSADLRVRQRHGLRNTSEGHARWPYPGSKVCRSRIASDESACTGGVSSLESTFRLVCSPQLRIELNIIQRDGPTPKVPRNKTYADVGWTGRSNRQARAQDARSIRYRTQRAAPKVANIAKVVALHEYGSRPATAEGIAVARSELELGREGRDHQRAPSAEWWADKPQIGATTVRVKGHTAQHQGLTTRTDRPIRGATAQAPAVQAVIRKIPQQLATGTAGIGVTGRTAYTGRTG